ncbi:unnamed protein product [Pedinophyceae sp. YPF-701]|nr:unnamed protein product [Pedinophyceae sp. YPF-701]
MWRAARRAADAARRGVLLGEHSARSWLEPASCDGSRGMARSKRMVEIILIEDVPHIGPKGTIARVRPGTARNHLVPGKLAKYATVDNREKYRQDIEAALAAKEESEAGATDIADAEKARRIETAFSLLGNRHLTFVRHPDRNDPSGSVTYAQHAVGAEDVAREAMRQLGVQIDQRLVVLGGSGGDKKGGLRAFGTHDVLLRVWKATDEDDVQERLKVQIRKKSVNPVNRERREKQGSGAADV